MNTYKILAASGLTMQQVKAAFIKNASVEKDFWIATPEGEQYAPEPGIVGGVLNKTLYELCLPTNTLVHADVVAWGYDVECKCDIVLDEVKKLSTEKNEIQAQMFREMSQRNDMHRYSLL